MMNLHQSKARGALGAVGLLLVGAALGVITDRAVLLHDPAPRVHAGTALDPVVAHEMFIQTFRDSLGASEEQMEAVHAILRQHQDELSVAWHDLRSVIDSTVSVVLDEVRLTLEPHQIEHFEAWIRAQHGERARPSATVGIDPHR